MIRVYIRMIQVGQLRSCFVRGLYARPGEGPADPGGVRMIREKVRMIRVGQTAGDFLSRTNFWGKIEEIWWMEVGETWGDARSTPNEQNPRIKINKTSSNQQITKKIGAIFGGDFRI